MGTTRAEAREDALSKRKAADTLDKRKSSRLASQSAPDDGKRVLRSRNNGPVVVQTKQQGVKRGSRAVIDATKASKSVKDQGSKVLAAKKQQRVQHMSSVVVDGETFKAGDCVYVIGDEFQQEWLSDDEEEACEVCGCTHLDVDMLECSRCLRGFHLSCLRPRLKAVPKVDWFCADCEAGRQAPPPQRLATAWQKLLYGQHLLQLWRITGFVQNRLGDGGVEFTGVKYCRPEDTYLGRQKHHGAREVFLTSTSDYQWVASIMRKAYVYPPADFGAALDGEEGNDVFMCEYEYDEGWRRFRRAKQASEDADGDVAMGQAGSETDQSSDDEDGDGTFKPIVKPRGKGRAMQRQAANLFSGEHSLALGRLGAAAVPLAERSAGKPPLAQLKEALALGSVPAQLPCRDHEKDQVLRFLMEAMDCTGDRSVLYICGVPGTGKTASVMEVLGGLRGEAQQKGAQFLAINCLQLPSPAHVYSKIWEKLTGQRLGPARALSSLEELYSGHARRGATTLLLLDEIDMLITRDQQVLYNLFEWPTRQQARLAVIGIANTHDIDERVLPRIASRLASSKLAFVPYKAEQIKTIVQGRLEAVGQRALVDDSAVDFAARKVAAETGDARRALELLRRATEIAELEQQQQQQQQEAGRPGPGSRLKSGTTTGTAAGSGAGTAAGRVTRLHVQAAIKEMFETTHMHLLRNASRLELMLLVAVVLEARAASRNDVVLMAAAKRLTDTVCSWTHDDKPCSGLLLATAARLASKRLLSLTDAPRPHLRSRCLLLVYKEDLAHVLAQDAQLDKLRALM